MIRFMEIDRDNYMECICLKVREDQKGFVADNARSLLEAHYEEGIYTRAIYDEDTMVGFVLFDYDPEIPGWSMSRMMIGEQYQGRGLGKAAVQTFLRFMKEYMGVRELYLCVETENTVAWEMYKKLGFEEVKALEYKFNGVQYRDEQMKITL